MNKEQERRKFVRLNTLVDVIYHKYTPKDVKKLSVTKNISEGGICLIAYESLKESDLLGLKLYLPEEKKPIDLAGKVAWVNEFMIGDASYGNRYDVGIEFIDAKDADLSKINKYVFSHISK